MLVLNPTVGAKHQSSRDRFPVLAFALTYGLVLGLLAGSRASGSDAEPTKAPNAVQNLVIGDTKVETLSRYQGPEPLPNPKQVLVYDFDVPPEVVTMDESAAARIHRRRFHLLHSSDDDSSPEKVAQQVQTHFSKILVTELEKTKVPTHIAKPGTPAPQHALVVQGYFTAVNEGNRSKRIMIGLGRGASDVCARVKVSLTTTNGQSVLLSEFNLNSESGKKPGAAEGMGASRAAASAAAGSAGGVAAGSVATPRRALSLTPIGWHRRWPGKSSN